MTPLPDLYQLPTLADALALAGDTPEESYKCPSCPRTVPAEGMVNTSGLPGELPEYVCHTCASGPHRLSVAAQAANGPQPSWSPECEARNRIYAERRVKLTNSDWTQVSDVPLAPESKAAWAAYRQALRDITDIFPSPADVVWPTEPAPQG